MVDVWFRRRSLPPLSSMFLGGEMGGFSGRPGRVGSCRQSHVTPSSVHPFAIPDSILPRPDAKLDAKDQVLKREDHWKSVLVSQVRLQLKLRGEGAGDEACEIDNTGRCFPHQGYSM